MNLSMVLLCECCVSLKLGSRFRGVTLSHKLCVILPSCLKQESAIDLVELLCVYIYRERDIVITVIAYMVHSLSRISWILIASLQVRYVRTW